MKTQKGKYVPLDTDFTVTVSKNLGKNRFDWEPDAVYITHDRREINLHYAGEKAGESSATFSLPADSSFLRSLASALEELADEYDD